MTIYQIDTDNRIFLSRPEQIRCEFRDNENIALATADPRNGIDRGRYYLSAAIFYAQTTLETPMRTVQCVSVDRELAAWFDCACIRSLRVRLSSTGRGVCRSTTRYTQL